MKRFSLGLIAMLHCVIGWSQSAFTLKQLNHRAFTADDGAPSGIAALAQTTDGTLWLGGAEGLTRFDGLRFVSYPGFSTEALPSGSVSALIASPDGGLWIGFRGGHVGFLKAGRLTVYGPQQGLPEGVVRGFAWGHDGVLWAAARGGLARLHGERWEGVAADLIRSSTAVLVDRQGTLWVATHDRVLARSPGDNQFHEIRSVEASFATPHSSLAMSADGAVWASFRGNMFRVDQPAGSPAMTTAALHVGAGDLELLFDDADQLWLGNESLYRLAAPDRLEARNSSRTGPALDEFTHSDGLTGDVQALFQDRERNVWVATSTGLERFTRGNVARVSLPLCPNKGYVLAAGDRGAVWAACPRADEDAGFLVEIRGGAVISRLSTPGFTATYRDRDGTIWFAGPTLLGHMDRGRLTTVPLPLEAAARGPQALVRDGDGSIWISARSRGVFQLIGGQWKAEETLKPLRGLVGAADPDGNLWFGSLDGRIARVQHHAVEFFDEKSGPTVGRITAICATADQVWVGGELGLARLDGARFVPVVGTSEEAFRQISGITSTRGGDLWLNTVGGIVHVERAELERASMDKDYHVHSEVLDRLDGVSGTPQFVRSTSSVIEADDGRLWFALNDGIVISIDALHPVRNSLAPPVTIWSISSGGKNYANADTTIQLPQHTTNLQIDYTAGSLTLPEHVQFRYMLQGSDRDWQDAGNRHEALYTNLKPGPYTFRVIASNNDGVWNADGASLRFTIAPAFYQTNWFYALCGAGCLGLLAALYRLRIGQVRAQVCSHLEARLGERERIARELHDTLLQGVQGLIWRFQAVADRISHQDQTRDLIEQALDRADQLLGESRERVKDLRTASSETMELSQALAAEGERLVLAHPAQFRATVEGTQRALHPIVREEVLLIAREALGNAFRHAAASHIEAEVSYGETTLQVRIRDDGQGISADVLGGSGRPGHFGLLGMRERAAKLRAQLNVWSKLGGGTEVDLQVAARVAYLPRDHTTRLVGWHRKGVTQ